MTIPKSEVASLNSNSIGTLSEECIKYDFSLSGMTIIYVQNVTLIRVKI